MALLNIFKKKKKPKKPKKVYEVEPRKVEPHKVKKAPPKLKRVSEIASRVLKGPQVTEKATDLVKKNQYVFKVLPRTNKVEIKRAIEDLYGVDVVSVKVIQIPPKKRRLGRIEGYRAGYKKAVIKVKEGQKIEVLPR